MKLSLMSHAVDALLLTSPFEYPGEGEEEHHDREGILKILERVLPFDFFEEKETEERVIEHQQQLLKRLIPLITYSPLTRFPGTISFFALSKYRPNSFKFFFEMITRWLIPGKRLDPILIYAADFRLPRLSEEVYTIHEVMVRVADLVEFEEIQRYFSLLATEIGLGIHSELYAKRLLEIKGLSIEDKHILIQGFISVLVKRFPKIYDHDIFKEMQHILITCRDEFKAARQPRHLSRIISAQYLFHKELKEAIKKNPQRRYLNLKIFRSSIQTAVGQRAVLSLIVAFNFLRDQESFSENNLLKAIQHYIPSASAVEHSFFIHKWGLENICLAYIEMEKKEGGEFTSLDIRKLRRELPGNLKNRVEHRLAPLFMPRNEEEIIRNLLILTNQIKYIRDIPQVFISFDQQVYTHLYFTVVVARVVKPHTLPIADLFKQTHSSMEYVHDRTKIMGYVRKKYAKEATVFHLKFSKEGFLRADHSIDLYKARQMVVGELTRVMGEVRDYNGGMISKQLELLCKIRLLLAEIKDYDELLLENFFYSLTPVLVRTLLDPYAFKTLFLMLHEGLKEYSQEGVYVKIHRQEHYLFVLVIAEDPSIHEGINREIQELHIPSRELAYAYVKVHHHSVMGYICSAHDPSKRERFLEKIEKVLQKNDGIYA